MAQLDYSTNFNAVDRNDRDSADYSTTIRTARYFLRIFCWALDRAVHTCFTVVIYLAAACIGKENWKTYRKATNGRHDFQIDLGLDLMAYAIALEWDGVGKRPGWMRQMKFLPCDCRKCYFCVNGHTNGIAHPAKEEREVIYANGARVLTVGCVEERVKILKKSGSYCRMCYRKQDKSLSHERQRMHCKTSTMGCPQCNEPICKHCWEEGYDMHVKK